MRIFKGILKAALVVLFLVGCNAALTFVLEPYGSRSQVAWSDYEQQADLDTILVGTSHMEYGVDPAVLNEECGYDAYNLGTPNQAIEESLVAIRTAYEDHRIKRVILGLSTSALTSSSPPNPGSAFMRNRGRYVSPLDSLATLNEFMWHYGSATTAYSLDFPFPWASNPVRSMALDDLADNVRAKIEKADVAEMAEKLEFGWHYVGLGHGARGDSMNLDSTKVRAVDEGIDEDAEAGAAVAENTATVDPDRARTMREICDYCTAYDIELIAIAPPLPVYDVFDEKSTYLPAMANITELLEGLGVAVYDFNLARPELFESKPEYFSDNFHLSLDGAQVFSRSLARFMNGLDAGDDMTALFNTPENQVRGIDYIAAVFDTTTVDSDGIHLTWRTIANPDAEIEYRVLEHHDGGPDGYHALCEWSRDTSFTYLPEQKGAVSLRIFARHVGSTEKHERIRTVKLIW